MRQIIFSILFILLTLATSAQPPRQQGGEARRGERERAEGIHTMQCNQIISVLQLKDATQQKFREIYMDYNRAVSELRMPQERNMPHEMEEPSDEHIEQMTIASFDRSIKSMEIKKEYYYKFREILSPSQITKMYNTERRIRDRAIEEMWQRNNQRGGGAPPMRERGERGEGEGNMPPQR